MKKYYKNEDPNKSDKLPAYESRVVKAYIPESLEDILKDQSRLQGMPVSRLIAIAIDKELDSDTPFSYPFPWPEDYEEYQYVSEGGKLLDYICKFRYGIGIEYLLVARRDIGIESREVLLTCLDELMNKEMVELVKPTRTKFKMWRSDYRVIRAKDIVFEDRGLKPWRREQGSSLKNKQRVKDKDADRHDT